MKSQQNENPYNICIFRPISECTDCSLKGRLNCHFDLKTLLRFGVSFFFNVIISSYVLILTGYFLEFVIFVVALIIFGIIFFGFWEIRILCSHCPWYAEKGRIIHCYGNYGCLKLWKYHPEPMSKSEKIQLIIGFFILFLILGFPAIVLIMNQQYYWGIALIIAPILFIWVIRRYHCRKCFNFSCPLNKMPKEVIDDFLRRNPVMRKAWENSGWHVNDKSLD